MTETDDSDICPNTRLTRWECECYDCKPDIFRFKFLCTGCERIEDVIGVLEGTLERFKGFKERGYTIGGGITDDYMHLIPPKRDGYYAIEGRCGHLTYVPIGKRRRDLCDECKLKGKQKSTT